MNFLGSKVPLLVNTISNLILKIFVGFLFKWDGTLCNLEYMELIFVSKFWQKKSYADVWIQMTKN